jgi:hypothetical protein
MQCHKVVVDVASKQVLVRAPPGSVSEKTLVWSQTPQIPVPIRTAPSGEGLNSGMPGLPRVGPWPPKRMIAPLPNVLLKSAYIPTYLSTALVEQPAQLDIYGRILVDIDHLDLGEQGWIRKSTSEWACSCIFAPKGFQGEDGLRVCQDYRRLNSVTVKNRTPIPRIDDLLDAAGGFSISSSLDLASGYHQIPLTEEEIPRSAFNGINELYEFTVMAFGFTNAPAVFQTAMQKALAGYLGKFVLVYLNDVLVFSKNPGEHLHHLALVLDRFCKYKLYLRSVKDVERFLGLANYFRKFVRGFGAITAPRTRLKRKNAAFLWSPECDQAFQYIKTALTSAPVLVPPDYSDSAPPFEVICDASGEGVGAGLFQGQSVIAFEGRKYRPAELNYTVGEQELLAAIHALQVCRCYLEGAPKFKVITDHNPLVYLNTQNTLSRRQSRWVEFLQQFDFEWVYRPGRFNPADPLSRAGSLAEQPLALLHDGLALVHLTCKSSSPVFLATSYWPQHDSLRCASQVLTLLLLASCFSPRRSHSPGGNMSTLLAALRRSPRLSNPPHGVVAPVPSRRSKLWELKPTEASPEMGSAAGQAALRGEALPAEDHSQPSDPCLETIGMNVSKGEGGCAGSLSDQVASDEALGELVVDFLDTVRKGYANDPFLSCAKDDDQFVLHDGLYWRAHQLVIPDYQGLRRKCLEASHDAPWAGHFDRDKTGALVISLYWWPKIQEDVADYVRSCPSCQRSKLVQHKPFGLLVPVQIPERRWSSIGIDFITHLPITTTGYDSIAVFVDRLTKRVHIEPCHD